MDSEIEYRKKRIILEDIGSSTFPSSYKNITKGVSSGPESEYSKIEEEAYSHLVKNAAAKKCNKELLKIIAIKRDVSYDPFTNQFKLMLAGIPVFESPCDEI